MNIDVEPDQTSFHRVVAALDSERGGEKLKADLAHRLHEILEPAAAEARGNVMAIQTGGVPHAGEPLRSKVAASVETYVNLDSRDVVVGIEAKKTGMPRGFNNAPKRLNERRGWRHPVYGTRRWVTQIGAPGWFDTPVQRRMAHYKRAVEKALQDVADRISRKA